MYVNDDVRAWNSMKDRYSMDAMYFLAWKGGFINTEAEIFWQFGAGTEFKVWCARQFLTELKGIVEGLKR